jgi:predicted NAD/FAD-binding protein
MDKKRMNIAIVGTGISGLSAAYLLHDGHEVTLFEKNSYIGGHSRTIEIKTPRQIVPVDTGFIVYNEQNYPLLTGLFRHLGVETQKSEMSFGASVGNGTVEYGSKGVFAQRRNFLRPAFWGMIADILRFNRNAEKFIAVEEMTLGECLKKMKMGAWFREYYLLAMGAAIWSCPIETIMQFPAATFIRFFKNHGLLTINEQPQWRTVAGGSRAYVKKISESFGKRVYCNAGVSSVTRSANNVMITDTAGQSYMFDHVIFASHADETLALLKDASEQEKSILGAFAYQKNQVVVHRDASFMPKNKKAWASWVYLSEGLGDKSPVSLTYWMNNLQNLPADDLVLVTLNPGRRPAEEMIYDEHVFAHPVFTREAVRAQSRLNEIQGRNRAHFCGAWTRYGFHEDGLMSGVAAAQALGAQIPWK